MSTMTPWHQSEINGGRWTTSVPLEDQIVNLGFATTTQIAEVLGVSNMVIAKLAKDIPTRFFEEQQGISQSQTLRKFTRDWAIRLVNEIWKRKQPRKIVKQWEVSSTNWMSYTEFIYKIRRPGKKMPRWLGLLLWRSIIDTHHEYFVINKEGSYNIRDGNFEQVRDIFIATLKHNYLSQK